MNCIICNKELIGMQRTFCSVICRKKDYYLRNKEKYKEKSRIWKENNKERAKEIHKKATNKFRTEKRERFNELIMKYYKKNKDKWNSRSAVYQVLKRVNKKIEIEKKCKFCNKEKDLKLKFEVYPKKADEIREAIKEKKIYYVCQECRK